MEALELSQRPVPDDLPIAFQSISVVGEHSDRRVTDGRQVAHTAMFQAQIRLKRGTSQW